MPPIVIAAPEAADALRAIADNPVVINIGRAEVLAIPSAPRATIQNLDAQNSHQVPELRLAQSVDGSEITVGVWDGGSVLASHVEFDDRVEIKNSKAAPNFHATHVAGTIAASGEDDDAEGMAPAASIISYDWTADVGERGGSVCLDSILSGVKWISALVMPPPG